MKPEEIEALIKDWNLAWFVLAAGIDLVVFLIWVGGRIVIGGLK